MEKDPGIPGIINPGDNSSRFLNAPNLFKKGIALAMCIGAVATGALNSINFPDAFPSAQVATAEAKDREKAKVPVSLDEIGGCESQRTGKDELYVTRLCASRGDKFYIIRGIRNIAAEAPYGVGIHKIEGKYTCGTSEASGKMIQTGTKGNKELIEAIRYCRSQHPDFQDGIAGIEKINDLDKGDGTESSLKKSCEGRLRSTFAKYFSRKQSIYNASGDKVSRSMHVLISKNENVENLFVRSQTTGSAVINGKPGKILNVRTREDHGRLGWGFTPKRCFDDADEVLQDSIF